VYNRKWLSVHIEVESVIRFICCIGLLLLTAPALAQETPDPGAPAAPEAASSAPAPAFESAVMTILINARTDLEILANQQLGSQRPDGWSGSLDVNNPQLAILIRLDLELLMARLVGLDNVPTGWFGAVPSTAYAIARDIRHDLELLTDVVLAPNVRPPGWAGGDPLMRCDRSTQNLVQLLARSGLYTPSVLPIAPNYCQQVALQVSQFTEVNLLERQSIPALAPASANPASADSAAAASAAPASGSAATTRDSTGLAYLDRYATQRVGAIPPNVPFEPVARSYTQFSNMTLVRGANFEVFVDYKTTTISDDAFRRLPDVNTAGANTFCQADWCTPVQQIAGMGSGGSRSTGSGGMQGKTLVNAGTNMIIYYDGEDQGGMTRVRMELCDKPTSSGQAVCEPVTEVILPDGTSAPILATINGLPQFYVPYQYTTTSARSRRYYTADLWINPPEARS
jgi:hypothetical protein